VSDVESARGRSLCDGRIEIDSPQRIRFRAEELFFLCGSGESTAWGDIPLEQARFHMGAFLQQRGFHFFSSSIDFDRKVLRVNTGPRVVVSGLQITNDTKVPLRRLRRPLGKAMTPDRLDQTQSWIRRELAMNGFPCAQVRVRGELETGLIHLDIQSNRYRRILKVIQSDPVGLEPGILSRYYAFQEGESYRSIPVELSSRRVESDGIVQDHRWNLRCEDPDHIILEENLLVGKPRVLSLALGIDTEEYLSGMIGWKSVRLGKRASSLDFQGRASFLRQMGLIVSNWYPFSDPRRPLIRTALQVERRAESRYASLDSELSIRSVWSRDFLGYSLRFEVGPSLADSRALGSPLPPPSQYLSLDAGLRWMSHPFEFYLSNPQEGYRFDVRGKFLDGRLLSPFRAGVIEVAAQSLFEPFHSDPRILIVGFRAQYITSSSSFSKAERSKLPIRFRQYLGGEQSVRGFSRLELPFDERVMMSSVHGGIELRSDYPFHPRVQPFVFFDAGLLGEESFQIETPVYFSPGGGLRWQSPIGSIRGTLAHGFVAGEKDREKKEKLSHWQWFLSLGREF
jgi:translocation and assembly module TamA